MKIWQPSISVKIGKYTSEEFWNAAVNLCRQGIGMPSFFNDQVVINALKKLGIPHERACDWAIVGCYEATTQGDAYPMTVAGGIVLPQVFWEYMQTVDNSLKSFDVFLNGFKDFFAAHYDEVILSAFNKRWQSARINAASPFESICVTGCIESGLAAEEGGARYNLFGVNILGIGTLVDSMLSIKKLIYEQAEFTINEMKQQLEKNFPDKKLLLECRKMPEKFGSDNKESNELAAVLSEFIAGRVLSSRLDSGARPYPGFSGSAVI